MGICESMCADEKGHAVITGTMSRRRKPYTGAKPLQTQSNCVGPLARLASSLDGDSWYNRSGYGAADSANFHHHRQGITLHLRSGHVQVDLINTNHPRNQSAPLDDNC